MMKLFAVRDVKADSFGAPMSIATVGLALRSFGDAVMNQKSDLYRFPEDYMLYEIGEYEPNSGTIKAHPLPVLVITATEARRKVVELESIQPSLSNVEVA